MPLPKLCCGGRLQALNVPSSAVPNQTLWIHTFKHITTCVLYPYGKSLLLHGVPAPMMLCLGVRHSVETSVGIRYLL